VTTYCRNGHRQSGNVTIVNMTTGVQRCPDCRVEIDEHRHVSEPPLWPVVLVMVVTLLLVGAWWWWMWLAPV
jgi:hypothetical protein